MRIAINQLMYYKISEIADSLAPSRRSLGGSSHFRVGGIAADQAIDQFSFWK